MALINSYYLYQRYEKRGNQPWIPSYPNTWSIDGDGTMPLVLKEEHDPSCYNPIYRWVQTQDTICIDTTTIDVRTTSGDPYCNGYDKYVDTTTEQSFDGGITWEFVSSASTLVEQDSEYCGYHPTPEVQYRWTESGTTCDNANKYKRYIKEVSYDGGYVWIVVTPPQYSAGTLVEADSYDCGYRTSATTSATYCSNANQYVDVYSLVSRDYGVTWSTASTSTELVDSDVYECGYRTGTTSGDPYCQGDDKYVDVYYRVSRDYGTTWITASTTPTLVEVGGCATPEVQYRWTPSGWTCVGYDKYQNNIKEQSTDGGETWTVVIPEEYSASTLIESQSTDCGYVPPTTDGKFRLTLSDSSTVSAECDSTSAITHDEISAYTSTLTTAEIGNCVTIIAGSAFYNCRSLTSVTIPNSVTSIKNQTFYGCSGLTSIDIPSGVTSIGSQAFYNCSSLSSVTIPNGVTSISDYTFSYCSSLTSVDIPNSVTSIGASTFLGCSGLTSIDIPSGVTSISRSTFNGCSSLTNVAIPSSVTSIGNSAFNECSSLTSIDIPSGVTSIGNNSFYNCSSLTSCTIGSSVTIIGERSFYNCSGLTSVVFPNSVTSIGNSAFNNCSSLTSVIVNATTPPTLGGNAFNNTSNCPIYVPSASVNTYKTTSGWSTYASRIQPIT